MHLLKCINLFVGLHEKTWQQTRLKVQCYRQDKEHTDVSLIVQTLNNIGTITQQAGKLFVMSIQPSQT
jgi:hypothetical protein